MTATPRRRLNPVIVALSDDHDHTSLLPRPRRRRSPARRPSPPSRAGSATAATRSASWPSSARSTRSRTCCCTASCRPRRSWRRSRTASPRPAGCRRRSSDLLAALPKWTTPMDALRTAVSVLAHFDPDVDDNSHEANLRKAERLLAQIPVAVADHYRSEPGQHAGRGPAGPRPRGQLPLHAPRHGGDAGRGEGARRVADPVRRARVQRLDLRGPRGRLDAVRPALGRRRRHRGAEGPAARRGEREGDGHAAGGRRRRRRPRSGSRRRWPARSGSWASATASTRPATCGPAS